MFDFFLNKPGTVPTKVCPELRLDSGIHRMHYQYYELLVSQVLSFFFKGNLSSKQFGI